MTKPTSESGGECIGWPKVSFVCFHNILQNPLNENFGHPVLTQVIFTTRVALERVVDFPLSVCQNVTCSSVSDSL